MNQPTPPDPYATAQAQTRSNLATATAQQETNMVGQNTPYGSVSYSQNGTNPDGTPRFSATTSYTPQMQSLVDQNINNAGQLSGIEGQLATSAASTLSKPVDLSWGATEANLDALGRQTLDPQFQQQGDQLDQKLYDQGLRPGTAAYDQAETSFNQTKNNAYDQLYLNGHQQAVSDILQQYNSPLNALAALRGGTQISEPSIGQISTPQAGVQGTNISGLIEDQYKQESANANAAMGGLFGLGGTLLGAGLAPATGGTSLLGKLGSKAYSAATGNALGGGF